MEVKHCNTWEAKIFIAGDIQTAKTYLRQECYKQGLCVTVEPVNFIYTGGEEAGMRIGFMNYARFPLEDTRELRLRIYRIAEELMSELCQKSCSVVTPKITKYFGCMPKEA